MAQRLKGRCGYPNDEPFWVTLHPERLDEPFKWRKSRRIFVCSMGDLFHEDVSMSFIAEIFEVIRYLKTHTFLLLTKRPQRMHDFIISYFTGGIPAFRSGRSPTEKYYDDFSHVWLGVTAENQEMADQRIPILLQTPAAVRFVSAEPLLGPIDLTRVVYNRVSVIDCLRGHHGWPVPHADGPRVHWVIVGGETGPNRRPANIEWIRNLRDQCMASDVSFFLKQMEINGRVERMPELDGRIWAEFPEQVTPI
jgi:protein gp37